MSQRGQTPVTQTSWIADVLPFSLLLKQTGSFKKYKPILGDCKMSSCCCMKPINSFISSVQRGQISLTHSDEPAKK